LARERIAELEAEVRAVRELKRAARMVDAETMTTLPMSTPGLVALTKALRAMTGGDMWDCRRDNPDDEEQDEEPEDEGEEPDIDY